MSSSNKPTFKYYVSKSYQITLEYLNAPRAPSNTLTSKLPIETEASASLSDDLKRTIKVQAEQHYFSRKKN